MTYRGSFRTPWFDKTFSKFFILESQSPEGRILSESIRAMISFFACFTPAALPASPVLKGFG